MPLAPGVCPALLVENPENQALQREKVDLQRGDAGAKVRIVDQRPARTLLRPRDVLEPAEWAFDRPTAAMPVRSWPRRYLA